MDVAVLLDCAVAEWRASPATFPAAARRYSPEEQAGREAALSRFLGELEAEVAALPRSRADRDGARERINEAFVRLAKSAMGLEHGQLDLLLGGGFSSIGTSLARAARRFDPEVSAEDILQACRNAWTACGLQVLLGRPMAVTPSIFAYSMLYPYSDNYLDDARISRGSKAAFNERFGRRLAGEAVAPANFHEEKIWRLVGLIEGEYPRTSHPEVHESLSAIHRAQVDGLRLARHAGGAVDVLRLTFAKGGASVLTDGYLAVGSLSPEEAEFAYQWGVLLQVGDDLQDVYQDRERGALTLFTVAAGREPLDAVTNRAFHFGESVMRRLESAGQAAAGPLKALIRRSSRSFLVRCAGEAGVFYSPEYLKELETCSPFRFDFLNRCRERVARRDRAFIRLFNAFLSADEDEPAFPVLPSVMMPRI